MGVIEPIESIRVGVTGQMIGRTDMCLTTVITTNIQSHDAAVHGWKVVVIRRHRNGRTGFGPAIYCRNLSAVWMYPPVGEWLTDPHHETLYPENEDSLPATYMAGFHAYLDRDSAVLKLKEIRSYLLSSGRHVIVKVTLKGLLAIGTEHIGPLGHSTHVSTVAVGNMIRIDSVERDDKKEG